MEMIEKLNIKVTPEIEDAFYFLNATQKEDDLTDEILECGKRTAALPKEQRDKAIHAALQMIENLKTYGIPCAEWA